MTEESKVSPEAFAANLAVIAEHYHAVINKLLETPRGGGFVDPVTMVGPFTELWSRILTTPDKIIKHQMQYASNYINIVNNVAARFSGQKIAPIFNPIQKDPRFKDKAWKENPYFDMIRQTYLMTGEWLQHVIEDTEGIDQRTSKKISFFTKQFVDALSPSNFLLTNPEVLRETVESNGENLVRGMINLREDIEKRSISTTNNEAFKIGENIAATKGKVIYQNDLMQLIYYEPLRPESYEVPLLIIPAWINKFYILDLSNGNSFVRWLLEKGYSVFMISWINPGKELSHKNFENYMKDGPMAALDVIEKVTGKKKVTAIGYCLGGTLLTSLLSYMAEKKDDRIVAATVFTTLIDFKDAGDLSLFIDEEQLKLLKIKVEDTGFFKGSEMASTFSLLRANEMIWSFIVNNYMMGKEPFPFDMLYWNSDSTNLPAAMHIFYLRNLYLKNALTHPGEVKFLGMPIDISKVNVPYYMLSCYDDHIAPWHNTYKTTQIIDKKLIRYVLAGSGHVAGVVNPPAKNKYSYWVGENYPESSETWFEKAKQCQGSWWPDWDNWNKQFSGKLVKALSCADLNVKPIEDAPGSYVLVRSS